MIELDKNNFAKKLLYRSLNRGYKENEIILGKFAASFLNEMSFNEMQDFEKILAETDADLYDWLTLKSDVPEKLRSKMMSDILKFKVKGLRS
jgi:antitoxin CptB